MRKRAAIFFLLFGAAAFAIGVFQLFKLRFEVGDVYPPYSSLRSDPLGTMALFESLSRMPNVRVTRDFSSVNNLPSGQSCTYLHLAASRAQWLRVPEEAVQDVQNFLLEGGRLVIAFLPETSRSYPLAGPGGVRRGIPPPPAKPGAKGPSDSPLFKDRWGVEFGFEPLRNIEGGTYNPVQVQKRTEGALPDSLDWHSGMIFTNLNSAWSIIYARGTNPVVVERRFGPGSVVLMTDCFCLSNEAMVNDRHAELLGWLIGSAATIQFDEAHLGLTESPGVSALMRQYRLEGLVIGVLLLVILFIWQHSTSFLPRSDQGRVHDELSGKEAAAGLVNLLRRNIAPSALLRVCFEEWTKSLGRRSAHSIARVDQAQALFETEASRANADKDPVRAYRQISNALKTPRHPDTTTNR